MCVFSNDEKEEQHSTDPENKEKIKDKKNLCKVKWSRDEVSLGFLFSRIKIKCLIYLGDETPFMYCKHLHDNKEWCMCSYFTPPFSG